MVGWEGRGGVGAVGPALTSIDDAWAYVASHLGHRCSSHSQTPWRHGSNDACGRSHVAITARSDGFSAGHGPRARKGGVAGASGGCGVASWSETGPPERRARASGRSNGGQVCK